jgi:dTDP-4-amino-4,6-dideoxy-D-galactose acyltransferase
LEYRILDWDSDFFGFSVARILPDQLDQSSLLEILDALKKAKVTLAYWAVDGKAPSSVEAGESAGGFLADIKVTYRLDLKSPSSLVPPLEIPVERYLEKVPSQDLLDLAFLSGQYSRFHRDPRIPKEKFLQLYRLWIEKSVQGELADSVLVFRDGPKIGGMVTLGREGDLGKIGLMAVSPPYQGKGIGLALLAAGRDWFRAQGLSLAHVVAQEANERACRFYEKAGYAQVHQEPIFHFW